MKLTGSCRRRFQALASIDRLREIIKKVAQGGYESWRKRDSFPEMRNEEDGEEEEGREEGGRKGGGETGRRRERKGQWRNIVGFMIVLLKQNDGRVATNVLRIPTVRASCRREGGNNSAILISACYGEAINTIINRSSNRAVLDLVEASAPMGHSILRSRLPFLPSCELF
uniref:Uncharacterized protein n=1 Tax=Vespula pensylvanica TaxID=30213 RepID=A0A834UFA4_VESPE|nr:hypothetical protein H0235_003769 [Vespula pensylvanica]